MRHGWKSVCGGTVCGMKPAQGRYMEERTEMLRIISGLYPRVPFVHISILSRIKYFLL